jgi:hypothetical protein
MDSATVRLFFRQLQTPQTLESSQETCETLDGGRCGICNACVLLDDVLVRRAMAFIVLRRSRNTRNYYLVESYRDEHGRSRKRTLCHLGREQDATDMLAKAHAHWKGAGVDGTGAAPGQKESGESCSGGGETCPSLDSP